MNSETTMTKKILLTLIALTTGITGCDSSIDNTMDKSHGMSEERLKQIKPYLKKYIDEEKLPGMVTAVARRGKIVHFESFGYSNYEKRTPLEKDALFRIYSMTKPVTGVALMIMLEEGKLRLEDPVSNYIPEFEDIRVLSSSKEKSNLLQSARRPVTIRDLATHTSGIAYTFSANNEIRKIYNRHGLSPYYFVDNLNSYSKGESLLTAGSKGFDDICSFSEKLASQAPLMHQPGDRYTYGMGIDVLGCVIARVSGLSFAEFLKRRIFDPLNMNDTFFQVPKEKAHRFTNLYANPQGLKSYFPEFDAESLQESPHLVLVDDASTSPFLSATTVFDGGSGLVSSALDYLTFIQMLENDGVGNGVRILGRKSIELMSNNHLSIETRNNSEYTGTGSSFPAGIGIGLTVGVTLDPALAGRYGTQGQYFWGGAAATDFWIDPEEDLVAVLMTQVLGSPWPATQDFEALVYAAIND